jgi:hypothetical protein
MNRFVQLNFLFFSLVFWSSCSFKPGGKQELSGIEVFDRYPLVNWDGAQANFDSYYDIYYYGDLRMYQYHYRYDSIGRGTVVTSRENTAYLVFHKDSSYGWKYDPFNPFGRVERVHVDSLLSKVKIQTFGLEVFLEKKPDSISTDKNGIRKEVYNFKETPEEPGDYTAILYFSPHMTDIEESFTPFLDSSRKMKFFKRITKTEAYYDKTYKMQFPKREGFFEMKRLEITNRDQLLNYFRDYVSK